jgi:hypothetical protein
LNLGLAGRVCNIYGCKTTWATKAFDAEHAKNAEKNPASSAFFALNVFLVLHPIYVRNQIHSFHLPHNKKGTTAPARADAKALFANALIGMS